MSSAGHLKKRYFPSYRQIEQRILNQHKKKHDQKVGDLQRKIQQLQGAFNLEKEHQQIKRKLLHNYHTTNHQIMKDVIGELNDDQEKLEKQVNSTQWGNRNSNPLNQNSASNSYSLNYCIDQDIEEDNHYENHLKFKKQVLERDLFENLHIKNDKKKLNDEQFIFKNLYNPRPDTAFNYTSQVSKHPKKIQNNYIVSDSTKQFKQNVKNLNKIHSRSSSNNLSTILSQNSRQKNSNYSSNKCLRKQQLQDQFMEQNNIFLKNTKILKDSYGKYLKQLSGTNIIKWRVLGGEKLKDTVNSSMNTTANGSKGFELKQIS